MTVAHTPPPRLPMRPAPEGESMAVALLRSRGKLLMWFAVAGLVGGIATALIIPRKYVSQATFIPQSTETQGSGLELAASAFGVKLPNTGQTWGPPVYVELLRSRMLLEPLALDTMTLKEEGGRRATVMDLVKAPDVPQPQRIEKAVKKLRKIVLASEDKRLNAVVLTVRTKWPSVSQAMAEELVAGVNRFNLETRKSQASAERQFVERQAAEAQRALRFAEDSLQEFLQENRRTGSPRLTFQQDRLERSVSLQQSVLTSLLQKREEVRAREVRDVPVITILEYPKLPATPEPSRALMFGVIGLVAASVLGVIVGLVLEGMAMARREYPGMRLSRLDTFLLIMRSFGRAIR